MATPLGSDIIDKDKLSREHCAHLMPTMCKRKQLPEEQLPEGTAA